MTYGAAGLRRALKMQARDQARVLQDKAALEVKVKDMVGTLEMVQTQRNELKQSYKARPPPSRLPCLSLDGRRSLRCSQPSLSVSLHLHNDFSADDFHREVAIPL